ncbi:MAG: ABC transporter permease [Thalassobaculaceae bacterium]|nr:ABC transporter permease [Thalassobaculaceae bacterium]
MIARGVSRLQTGLAAGIGLLGLLGIVLPVSDSDAVGLINAPLLALFAGLAVASLARFGVPLPVAADGALTALAGIALVSALAAVDRGASGFWCLTAAGWLTAWLFVERLTAVGRGGWIGVAVPVLFGVTLLVLWELLTRGMNVPQVLLPPPSAIGVRFAASIPILWADFQQTFLKAVLIGYALGSGSAFLVAIAIDRSPFLQRGLLPVGNLISALPIIGIAPIMVMWFGFDWPSKAAVVIVMTFFPMLVNTVAGLAEAGRMERDLMRTYAAGYWQTLVKLRLPAAAPFIFNALKINSTLALIGAIVAEFFGTPIVGMGFRISTEVGRMNVDMVWAEIAVAALAGSAFFGAVALIERAVTFWHPSNRQ